MRPAHRNLMPVVALGAFMALGLGGCVMDSKDDLNAWLAEVKQRPGGRLDPIPEMKPTQPFDYSAATLRNPFEPVRVAEEEVADNGLRPDMDRRKEELEKFPIDALSMLGVLEKPPLRYALIRDGNGVIHQALVGNHAGQNYGTIVSIHEDRVELTEIVPDGQGGWTERPSLIKQKGAK